MKRFIQEFLQYNDWLTIGLIVIPWIVGLVIILDNILVKPIQWYWNNLWKGMNDTKRYKVITYTFTTKLW